MVDVPIQPGHGIPQVTLEDYLFVPAVQAAQDAHQAELLGKGSAGGVATLDEEGLLPESQVPERLQELQLNATIDERVAESTIDSIPLLDADIASDVARVAAKFAPRGPGISLYRSGTTHMFRRGIGDGRYWRCDLPIISSGPGAYPLHQVRDQYVEVAAKSVVYGSTGMVSSGTWTTAIQAAAYGGQYTQASAAGAYVEYTTPAGTTTVGFRTCDLSNAGLAKVTVDGDATKAALLPTADDLVKLGVYPNTILIANGGSLNPTDRVYEGRKLNSANYDKIVLAVTGLTPGVHTIRVTATGYYHTGDYPGANTGSGSTASRVYLTGFVTGNGTMKEGDSGVDLLMIDNLMSVGSAWEYANNTKPAGASSYEFLGNIHGYEVEDSFTTYVDDAAVTLSDKTPVFASRSAKIVRTSHLLHPQTGSTVIANIVTTYVMDRRGLSIEVLTDWQVDATIISAYIMMPLNGSTRTTVIPFTKGNLSGHTGGPLTLPTGSDGYFGHSESAAAWMWHGGGVYGAAVWVPDVLRFTRGFATRGFLPNIQSRPSSGPISKVYIPRAYTDSPETVAPGTRWHQAARYAIAYFPEGADTALNTF